MHQPAELLRNPHVSIRGDIGRLAKLATKLISSKFVIKLSHKYPNQMQPGLGVSLDFPCKKSLMGGLGSS